MRITHTTPQLPTVTDRPAQAPNDRRSDATASRGFGAQAAAPERSGGAAQNNSAAPNNIDTVQAHLDKMQTRIDRVADRITAHLGEDAAAAFVAEIEAVQSAFLGSLAAAGEAATSEDGAAPAVATPGSLKSAIADVINTYRQFAQDGAWPGDVAPVDGTGDGDPVDGVVGEGEVGGSDDVVAEDPVVVDPGADEAVPVEGDPVVADPVVDAPPVDVVIAPEIDLIIPEIEAPVVGAEDGDPTGIGLPVELV